MSKICKYCGRELDDSATYCDGCGGDARETAEELGPGQIRCINCGGAIDAGTRLCPFCGAVMYNTGLAEDYSEMESIELPTISDDTFVSERTDDPEDYEIDSVITPPPKPVNTGLPPKPVEVSSVSIAPKRVAESVSAPLLRRPAHTAPNYSQPYVPDIEPEPEEYISKSSAIPEAILHPIERDKPKQETDAFGDPVKKSTFPNSTGTAPGEIKKSLKKPIIIVVSAAAVLLFLIFFLFRNELFGSKDDSSSSKSSKKSAADITAEITNIKEQAQ